jgi:hypothetical protein
MEVNNFSVPQVLSGLGEKSRNWKERLTVVMSYTMFPAVLHIKNIYHVLFYFLLIFIFSQGMQWRSG